jgi:RNA polymerase sigma factor (sigma-70 family)
MRYHCQQRRDPRREEALRFTQAASETINRQLVASTLPPDVLAARLEECQCVADAIEELEEPYRQVVQAHFLEGLSRSECAAQLGLSEGAVANRLRTAIKLLGQRLRNLRKDQ